MATKRFGYLDDLSLKNQKVGIGTSTANEKLEVLGGTRGGDVVVTGIATLTSYEGFQNKKTSYVENISINSGESGSLSEIVIGTGTTLSVGTGATSGQGNIKSLKVSNTFTPPIGGINDRPSAPQTGALFYNKDFKTIEYWDGSFWRQVDNTTQSGRMVIWDGRLPNANTKTIEYVNIHTKGNTSYFGYAIDTAGYVGGVSNSIRGVFAGRTSPSESIEYVTLASQGNSTDFGDLTGSREQLSGVSNSTRGIFCGGMTPTHLNTMEYIQIMTTGNAIDFGDLTQITIGPGTVSNGTRGVIAEADQPIGRVSQITISSLGNAVDVGSDITGGTGKAGGASSGTRGLWAGGYTGTSSPYTDVVRGVTISSAGNAIEFGNLTKKRAFTGGSGSQTRGVWCSGRSGDGWENIIDYVSIHSGGQAEDFGDLMFALTGAYPVSDCHGGLGGY